MGSTRPLTTSGPETRLLPVEALRAKIFDFWSLTKPEVNFLIVIATLTGFILGSQTFSLQRLLNTLLGTLLVASGTSALNQYLEHHFDAQMRRTCRRPVASGRMSPTTAARFGFLLAALGSAYLLLTVNALASILAGVTLMIYLSIYTPLKRKTPFCTFAGAIPGAMPVLIGWAAAAGSLNDNAWILYAVLFFWQFPHFMAIAWMYREDYARAGYLILPAGSEFRFLAWQTSIPLAGLLMASVAGMNRNHANAIEYGAMLISGIGFLYYTARFLLLRSRSAARRLLRASIVYLPIAFLILTLAKN
jgi:protoheme IX farnesyltransferase